MKQRAIVSFLSDYGLQDEFVGICHGVMLRIAPHVRIVDIHHSILRQDIRHGAVVLQQSVTYIPDSVHLAVDDPTVGSDRRAVIVESSWGEVFVGPDNGLLIPAAESCGGVRRAFQVTDNRFLLTPVSRTFQGRDVFSPVTAHIANGVDPSEFGPAIPTDDLVRLEVPEAWVHEDHLHAEILQVDRFGNLQMNFACNHLEKVALSDEEVIEIRLEGHRLRVPLVGTFSDVEPGSFVLVEDSYRHMSLAINKGDAAAKLRARTGSTAIVGPIAKDN